MLRADTSPMLKLPWFEAPALLLPLLLLFRLLSPRLPEPAGQRLCVISSAVAQLLCSRVLLLGMHEQQADSQMAVADALVQDIFEDTSAGVDSSPLMKSIVRQEDAKA